MMMMMTMMMASFKLFEILAVVVVVVVVCYRSNFRLCCKVSVVTNVMPHTVGEIIQSAEIIVSIQLLRPSLGTDLSLKMRYSVFQ